MTDLKVLSWSKDDEHIITLREIDLTAALAEANRAGREGYLLQRVLDAGHETSGPRLILSYERWVEKVWPE